jgi:hypothetical protein
MQESSHKILRIFVLRIAERSVIAGRAAISMEERQFKAKAGSTVILHINYFESKASSTRGDGNIVTVLLSVARRPNLTSE